MQSKNLLDISEFEALTGASILDTKIESLLSNNIEKIKKLTNTKFELPIAKQIILLLYLAYTYKIDITKCMALYQLYANDLIVIVLSLLSEVVNIVEISNKCMPIYHKFTGNIDINIPENINDFYQLLLRCKFGNKLYIPSNLW